MMHIKRRVPRPCYINRAGLNEQQALARRAGYTAERLQIVQVMPIVSFCAIHVEAAKTLFVAEHHGPGLWRALFCRSRLRPRSAAVMATTSRTAGQALSAAAPGDAV
jgi:hypothetical protein